MGSSSEIHFNSKEKKRYKFNFGSLMTFLSEIEEKEEVNDFEKLKCIFTGTEGV